MVYHRYGTPDVLRLEDVDLPAPGDKQVLVRVRAASVNPYDWHHLTGTPYFLRLSAGLRRPKEPRLGLDYAGVVEAVGPGVTALRPGDEVFGMRTGSFAEYLITGEHVATRIPQGVSFEQAAATPLAALTALQALRKGEVRAGQRVLVNGASGGVGTFAVQLAKTFGAQVTAVCSPHNVDAVRRLGADRVIDYTREDFVRSGQRYDVIIDGPGNRSLADRRRALTPTGALVLISGPKTNRWLGPATGLVKLVVSARFGSQKLLGMLTQNTRQDLELIAAMIRDGRVTPVIERTLPLHELPEALRYVGTGHARGKIVITVQ